MPTPDPEPQPWSAAWAASAAWARWRAAQPVASANYVGPLTEPLNYPTFLTALRPPPSDAEPTLDAQAAYASARANAAAPRTSGAPTIFLAMADIRGSKDILVYVLRWENVGWAPSGPPPRVGSRPRFRRAVGPCIVLIDATTGVSFGTMFMSSDRA